MSIFIGILPLLGLATLSVLGISGVRQNITSETSLCISSVSKIQHQHKKLTNRLLGLNSTAKLLRIKRASAELSYKLAPIYLKPSLFSLLQIVIQAQRAFRLVQKSILNTAILNSQVFYARMTLNRYQFSKKSSNLEVSSYPQNSDSPSYKLKSNYSNIKRISMYRYFNLTKNFPDILSKMFNKKRGVSKCGATIIKSKNNELQVKIIMDR